MQLNLFETLDRLGIAVGSCHPIVIVIADGRSIQASHVVREQSPSARHDASQSASAVAFFDLLSSGEFGITAALPALSEDLHTWYRLWCERVGKDALIKPQFVAALIRAGRIVTRRKRLETSANLIGKQLAVAYRSGRRHGQELERAALTQRVMAFRAALADFHAK